MSSLAPEVLLRLVRELAEGEAKDVREQETDESVKSAESRNGRHRKSGMRDDRWRERAGPPGWHEWDEEDGERRSP